MASSTYKVGQRVKLDWPTGEGSTGVIRGRTVGGYAIQLDNPALANCLGAVRAAAFPDCIDFSVYWIVGACDGLLDV